MIQKGLIHTCSVNGGGEGAANAAATMAARSIVVVLVVVESRQPLSFSCRFFKNDETRAAKLFYCSI